MCTEINKLQHRMTDAFVRACIFQNINDAIQNFRFHEKVKKGFYTKIITKFINTFMFLYEKQN